VSLIRFQFHFPPLKSLIYNLWTGTQRNLPNY
jgi:hypothetical protein